MPLVPRETVENQLQLMKNAGLAKLRRLRLENRRLRLENEIKILREEIQLDLEQRDYLMKMIPKMKTTVQNDNEIKLGDDPVLGSTRGGGWLHAQIQESDPFNGECDALKEKIVANELKLIAVQRQLDENQELGGEVEGGIGGEVEGGGEGGVGGEIEGGGEGGVGGEVEGGP